MTQPPMSVAEWYPEQLPQALRTAAGLTDEELAALVPFAGAFADLAAVPNARVVTCWKYRGQNTGRAT